MESVRLEKLAMALTAAFSLLLSGVALVSMVMLGILLSEVTALPLHAQTSPAVALEAATKKEQVDGDLKTAIADYQKIAADKSAPRDVRAKALLHLAGCYEKLGQQAQGVYQQIVRDFADQPAATQALPSHNERSSNRSEVSAKAIRTATAWSMRTGRPRS